MEHFPQRQDPDRPHRSGEPAINLPPAIAWFGLALCAIHAFRVWAITPAQDRLLIDVLAFIPARYAPGGEGLAVAVAAWWSPFTYSLLHADWLHLGVNLVWLAAFGSPCAARLGTARSLLLAAAASAGGAALHLAFNAGEAVPVVGASAVVSGYMGAAARFAFRPGGAGGLAVHGPALSLSQSLADRRVATFIVVWAALNLLFGVLPLAGGGAVAWQAHVGGFAVGLLAFSWFDRSR